MIMHLFSLFPLKGKGKNLLGLSHGVLCLQVFLEEADDKGGNDQVLIHLLTHLIFQWYLWKAANIQN